MMVFVLFCVWFYMFFVSLSIEEKLFQNNNKNHSNRSFYKAPDYSSFSCTCIHKPPARKKCDPHVGN